jgi:hypothetical protein
MNDGVVLAAWADRTTSNDPWMLRWVSFKGGEKPGEARVFTIPPGGSGGQAMSPSITSVPGGRFLLLWTEGPAASHQVRGLTLRADGTAVGDAFAVSPDGVNAGQAQAAVTSSGKGVVAFLASKGHSFELVATALSCTP